MAKPRTPTKAETFAVWGSPPASLTKALTPRQLAAFRSYVDGAMNRCYRLAFDCGFDHAVSEVADIAKQKHDARLRKLA